ncbi:hypothetical protein HPB52_004845 [Rhipicephalus sanguineus]|uniref:Uncharacterized protein n=1 Tax=Rhipicephalus sanguineus TaxID=34632 RepID=A0A9D4SVP6_RHISA|nr:hypothetical protein HPB52_004845 [Rhipicephalus sanguineus]
MEGGGRGTNGSSPPPAPPPCGPPPPRVQPVRLSKQSEVEMAEEQAPAPVTIRLEVGTEEEASPQPVDNTSRASAQVGGISLIGPRFSFEEAARD